MESRAERWILGKPWNKRQELSVLPSMWKIWQLGDSKRVSALTSPFLIK